jgi:uncharacterized protein YndB with AHSA1/START domain
MAVRPEPASDTADREIVVSRVLNAPRELVFDAFTDPRHIGNWWGPNGFSITTRSMEVRPGGMWVYTMHGPDGANYPNWTRYHDVVRPERLVYDHGGSLEGEGEVQFRVTVTFTAHAGGTEVTMRSVFPTKALRDHVVERYGAIEGGKQNLARLAGHVEAQAKTGVGAREAWRAHAQRRFSRRFAAPRALVWQAWTDPAHLAAWWGPHGFTNPTCVFEARVGGRIHILMRGPDGADHPMHGEVRELVAPGRLVFLAQPLDGQGQPLFEVVNTVTFADAEGGTLVTVTTDVSNATPAAQIPLEGMEVGWTQSLERLDELLTAPDAALHPERDIVTTRVFTAPRAQVYAAWTDPAVLQRWWGPKGFTNTFQVCEPRPGGEWRFTMHGPDGKDFQNHSVFRELIPGELVAFDHLGPMHAFQVRTTFYDFQGGTLVRFRMRFADTAEVARIRGFIAPANEQNFDRLAAALQ